MHRKKISWVGVDIAKHVFQIHAADQHGKADAAAICEALTRPDMRFVSPKSIVQQDSQAMHRIRSELISQRTAKANQIRGLVGEYGLTAPLGMAKLRQALPEWLEDAENGLTIPFRVLLQGLYEDLKRLDERVTELDKSIAESVACNDDAQRLLQLRGVGVFIASAFTGALGDAKAYGKGREFAASLGLTPRQHSSGGKNRLLGISKRGDSYLRQLLIHGARAVIRHVERHHDALSCWIKRMLSRKHVNVVTAALANKTARMAWAIVHGQVDSDPALMAGR